MVRLCLKIDWLAGSRGKDCSRMKDLYLFVVNLLYFLLLFSNAMLWYKIKSSKHAMHHRRRILKNSHFHPFINIYVIRN